MKTAVANFLISYFVMKLSGLEKYKMFFILENLFWKYLFIMFWSHY